MIRVVKLNPSRTYATEANARKAAEAWTKPRAASFTNLSYMVVGIPETGRFAPVFFGPDAAIHGFWIASGGFTVVG